jgi:hypothetical protein
MVETLVNGEMQDGRFVIDGPQKLFRLDRLVATAVRVRDRSVRR